MWSFRELSNFNLVDDHLPNDLLRTYTQMKTRRDSMSPKPRESRLLNRPVEDSNVLSSETDDVEVLNDKPPPRRRYHGSKKEDSFEAIMTEARQVFRGVIRSSRHRAYEISMKKENYL